MVSGIVGLEPKPQHCLNDSDWSNAFGLTSCHRQLDHTRKGCTYTGDMRIQASEFILNGLVYRLLASCLVELARCIDYPSSGFDKLYSHRDVSLHELRYLDKDELKTE